MRYIILFVLIVGCGDIKSDDIRPFIPGIYVRESHHEFGTEYDTMVIAAKGELYVIERKWKYTRVLDGVRLEPEYKAISSTAMLKEGVLTEQESGISYSLDPAGKMLESGRAQYLKLK